MDNRSDGARPGPDAAAAAPDPGPAVVIVPGASFGATLRELAAYRDLLYFLAWKDFKVRYKQTTLGAGWAILQPTLTMIVFTVFFGKLGGLPSDGHPYPVFTYTALLPWMLFAYVLTQASLSVVAHQDLITKVYFPRLLVVLAPIGVALVDFALAFAVLLGLMAVYGIAPGPGLLAVPLFVGFAALAAVAVGVWLAALNVRYRDVRYVIPFVVNVWLFASPVAYPASVVPERWRWLYGLNPMTGVIEGFRWALLGGTGLPVALVGASAAVTLIVFVTGVLYFARLEQTFADVV